jgi:hypothetical protein
MEIYIPIIQSLIIVFGGGIIATLLSERYANKRDTRRLRYEALRSLVIAYQRYHRLVRGNRKYLEDGNWDEVHSLMLAEAKILGLMFDSEELFTEAKSLANKMATVKSMRLNGDEDRYLKHMEDVSNRFKILLNEARRKM